MSTSHDDVPPAKRQRTMSDSESQSSITRSGIWHNDGSVIFQAETTQFRVHWSVLSLHSGFFRDMRDLPQPLDQPSLEGCPVIELHDSAEDVTHLLNALYNQLLFSEKSLSFPFIAAIVRMGRKYDFESLFAAAAQRLAYEYPTTLEDYQTLTSANNVDYSSTRIDHYPGMSLDLIPLAREHGLYSVLPCAYLRAVLYNNPEKIMDGIPGPHGRRITLSSQDQRVCILAGRKFLEAQWKHRDSWEWLSLEYHLDTCTGDASCDVRKKKWFRGVVRKGHPLVPFRLASGAGLCGVCERHHVAIMADGRRKLWDELPSFFGLPPWSELKNDVYTDSEKVSDQHNLKL
ncbi:hypothetical protein DFH06DRAFT_1234189 [Mycena polygramma]|nr:hypothetical protein DFH06DRAFT_1234189 [Mycena polygramma]